MPHFLLHLEFLEHVFPLDTQSSPGFLRCSQFKSPFPVSCLPQFPRCHSATVSSADPKAIHAAMCAHVLPPPMDLVPGSRFLDFKMNSLTMFESHMPKILAMEKEQLNYAISGEDIKY